MIYEGVNVDVQGFERFFPIIKSSKRGMKREVLPLNVDNRIGISGGRRGVNDGGRNLKEGGGYEDHSQERVTVRNMVFLNFLFDHF